jgi:hypothetical protein
LAVIEPYLLLSILALSLSALAFLSRVIDKNLSIREFEAYAAAVSRDVQRVELRLLHLEQTRPTTGELEILAESLNKRLDEVRDIKANPKSS